MKPLKLGRLPSFDDRSRNFSVRRLMSAQPPRSQEWYCPLQLDQAHLSACTGFAWAHFLAAMPQPVSEVTAEKAIGIYRLAQTLDEWPGEAYEGSSVTAAVKAVQQRYPGLIDAYHWAFGIDDLVMALGYVGPVVLGIPWYNSMFDPDWKSVIHPSGVATGGHAILASGVNIEDRLVRLHNSWGADWGLVGDCFISFDDLARLLREDGEACVATGKHMGALA